MSPEERIVLKENLCAAGLMERTDTVAPFKKPGISIARSIFCQLEIDEPKPSEKVSLGKLNAAMATKGYSFERKIQTKATLHAAGILQD